MRIQEQLYERWLRHWSSPKEQTKQWGREWQESTCIAELMWLSWEFPLQPHRFLSCPACPIPRSIPNPSSLSFPTGCRTGSLGLTHSGTFPFLPRGEILGEERVPLNAVFMQDEKLFWPQNYENSGGFHQTPPASIVRVMLIKGTADSALKKADNQIR